MLQQIYFFYKYIYFLKEAISEQIQQAHDRSQMLLLNCTRDFTSLK